MTTSGTESLFAGPKVGTVWEERYRVLGQSAVWADMVVCELLTGPNRGETVVLAKESFSDVPRGPGEGAPVKGLAPARRRATESST